MGCILNEPFRHNAPRTHVPRNVQWKSMRNLKSLTHFFHWKEKKANATSMHIYNRQLARLLPKQHCRGSFAAEELRSNKSSGHCIVQAIWAFFHWNRKICGKKAGIDWKCSLPLNIDTVYLIADFKLFVHQSKAHTQKNNGLGCRMCKYLA